MWYWARWRYGPRRRVTGTDQTTRTLEDGSRITTKRTSYNNGPDIIRTTRTYRSPDGSRRTVSTSKTSTGEDTKHLLVVLAAITVFILFFGWPWFLHIAMDVRIAIACGWYALLVVGVIVGTRLENRNKAG